ncbi:hypothetical protein ACFQY5_19120 [Paeniroseomonas aquatica]|uniref:Uncharacterized protein n=1 Tax=Paeniroseomonas aquatica TaxID=373043 RepID=A0ABT8AE93_9PROT|nr:hypothetical protein [Paeniroseomonas aquatica]MDN3567980.1 hypothetical protein [Paeniroseomonas aquatica]
MILPRILLPAVALLLAGCSLGVGPQRLHVDQLGYASAMGEGLKRQMLLNMVRLRYADVPAFVSITQMISGYTVQSTGQLGLNAYPNAAPGNFFSAAGSVQYTDRPTFTFTPVTGEQFAQSYLRPLAPAELLSLAQSGAPIDLLFRIGVHSVNGLANEVTRSGGSQQASGGFQELMRALVEIQHGGALGLRFERQGPLTKVFLLLDDSQPGLRSRIRDARRLLGAGPAARELEVVYGRSRGGQNQVALLTRSMLQVLYEFGTQIEVSAADVERGETRPTDQGDPRDRVIRVRQGTRAPADAYAAVAYRDRWFWIDSADLRSKTAFTFAYILQVLAESGRGQATPVVTIPAQ